MVFGKPGFEFLYLAVFLKTWMSSFRTWPVFGKPGCQVFVPGRYLENLDVSFCTWPIFGKPGRKFLYLAGF
jgi:hypothetical protein